MDFLFPPTYDPYYGARVRRAAPQQQARPARPRSAGFFGSGFPGFDNYYDSDYEARMRAAQQQHRRDLCDCGNGRCPGYQNAVRRAALERQQRQHLQQQQQREAALAAYRAQEQRREEELREAYLARQRAYQSQVKARAARRNAQHRLHALHQRAAMRAATKIQRWWRHHRAVRAFSRARAAVKVQRWWRKHFAAIQAERRDAAARVVTRTLARASAVLRARRILDALRAIKEQHDRLLALQEEYEAQCTGLPDKHKTVLTYQELIERSVLALDGISTRGSDFVRERRKANVKLAQSLLDRLDKRQRTAPAPQPMEVESEPEAAPESGSAMEDSASESENENENENEVSDEASDESDEEFVDFDDGAMDVDSEKHTVVSIPIRDLQTGVPTSQLPLTPSHLTP